MQQAMEILGYVTLGGVGILACLGVGLVVWQSPSIARYLRIRRM